MLVLSRKEAQRIRVGDSIVVSIVKIAGDKVRVGIEAPSDVLVLRDELEAWDDSARDSARESVARGGVSNRGVSNRGALDSASSSSAKASELTKEAVAVNAIEVELEIEPSALKQSA